MRFPTRSHVATALFAFFLPGQDVDTMVGDLEEEYGVCVRSRPALDRWYWAQVVRSIPVLLWRPVARSGWRSTIGVALVACAMQAVVELGAGFAVHGLSPTGAQWPAAASLVVTLPALVGLSYRASRIRPGASIVLAMVAAVAIAAQALLTVGAGRGLPLTTLAGLFVCPTMALTGGFLALRPRHR